MTVCLLTSEFKTRRGYTGGIGTHFRDLAEGLAARGHRVVVVFVSDAPVAEEKIPGVELRVVSSAFPGWLRPLARLSKWLECALHPWVVNLRTAPAVARAVRESGAAGVETTSYQAVSLLYSLFPDSVPVFTRVSTPVNFLDLQGARRPHPAHLLQAAERAAILVSPWRLTHTRSHAGEMRRWCGLSERDFHLIPHGVARPTLPVAPAERRVGEGGMRFLFVGRWERRKGIDVLLRAVPAVLARHPDAGFRFVGSGRGHDASLDLERFFPEGVPVAVQPLGFLSSEEVENEYARCDVLVVPSRYESFGLVYVEGMWRKKAVVGTTGGGIPEVVTHGRNGLLVPPGESEALADALCRLASDPELVRRLGEQGYRDAAESFSVERLAQRSEAFYAAASTSVPVI